MFSTTTYIQRRAALQQQFSTGLLILMGNSESPMNYKDNTYHFRQDSSFLYYLGISAPDLRAIIDIDENTVIVFGNEMSIDDIVWMGQLETLASKASKAGVTRTLPLQQFDEYVIKAQLQKRTIHFLPPYRADNKIALSALLQIPMPELQEKASVQLIKAVAAQRSVKEKEEIIQMEDAVNISVDMHLAAMQLARPGMKEEEIAARIQEVAMRAGGNIAYPTILTIHGEILHNHHHGNILKEGDLVLNDSGAENTMFYAGDLTRTFPAGKKFTPVQKTAYNIVLEALEKATAALKPGVRYLDIHLLSCKVLVDGLKEMGLMKGNAEDAVAAGAHALFFQCGTGHMIGMDVHDMEDLGEQYIGYTDSLKKNTTTFGLKSLRLGKELEKGYVVTVEPGLYFIPELIDMWKADNKLAEFINYDKVEQFKAFGGIRIEDDIVITDNGYRILGKHLAKSVEEVEAIRETAF